MLEFGIIKELQTSSKKKKLIKENIQK